MGQVRLAIVRGAHAARVLRPAARRPDVGRWTSKKTRLARGGRPSVFERGGPPRSARQRRALPKPNKVSAPATIFIRGIGAGSPAGWGVLSLREALAKGEP